MDLKVENDGGGRDCSSNEEEASDDLHDSASEISEEYVGTDEEEKEWDEDWIVSVSEESDSELDADSEDYDEYEQDLARADSLMEELSLDDTAMSKSVRHRFIEVRRELDV
ncbi:hypothetical protein ATEIFO6365_0005008100 [Aspergillus terreus]|uniref:Uncharacterized protein n=1 Tax=Aspergillus terreus TaxID=33178 RepID=A0A5M3Z0K5_ASPTE|nr:hypothetical protein ATETN484_0007008600 [Aspergillus terreus]GFF15891.1 hypothetical protein ATEIFO6365_0005008100 [Aspergillus terreus]